jgi:hypothetical protein
MLKLDIESIRVPHERTYAARVEQHPLCGALASQLVPAERVLGEGELTTMVGGPRRARLFTRELDRWQPSLPFRVEISEICGAKVYRVAGLQ